MKRWRFWAAQFIWLMATLISGIAGSEGDGEVIPVVLLFAFVLSGFTLGWGAKGKNEDENSVTAYNGHVVARVMATALIWITYMGGSVASVMEMAGWGVLLALILMVPAIAFTGLIWTWERISGVAGNRMQSMAEQAEKRKRSRVDSVLSDLSDNDLARLRDRLADSEREDERVFDHVSDDGELVYRRH